MSTTTSKSNTKAPSKYDPVNFIMNREMQLKEQWGSPSLVLATAALIAFLAGSTVYYTLVPMFRPTGTLHGATDKWYAGLSGLPIALFVSVAVFCVGSVVGLTQKTTLIGVIVASLAGIIIGFLFNFAFTSAADGEKNQFIGWTFLSVFFTLGFVGLSVYYLRRMIAEKKAAEVSEKNVVMVDDQTTQGTSAQDAQEPVPAAKGIESRSTWIYVLSAVALVGAAILIYIHYDVHGSIDAAILNPPSNGGTTGTTAVQDEDE